MNGEFIFNDPIVDKLITYEQDSDYSASAECEECGALVTGSPSDIQDWAREHAKGCAPEGAAEEATTDPTVSPRVIALLNWYEESPAWLAETVASLAKLCSHVIAVDGPYAAFPGGLKRPYSGTDQADAIFHTAAGAGMGCTIHTPRQPWWGGEVEKRDTMFQLGKHFTTPADWFLRIDADEILTEVPANILTQLAQTDADVAEVTLWDRESTGAHPLRCLFRALPQLRVEGAHYRVTAGGWVLCGRDQVWAEPLWDVRLEHRTLQRTPERRRLKQAYSQLIPKLESE